MPKHWQPQTRNRAPRVLADRPTRAHLSTSLQPKHMRALAGRALFQLQHRVCLLKPSVLQAGTSSLPCPALGMHARSCTGACHICLAIQHPGDYRQITSGESGGCPCPAQQPILCCAGGAVHEWPLRHIPCTCMPLRCPTYARLE